MTTFTPRILRPRANDSCGIRTLSYLLFFVAAPALTTARPTPTAALTSQPQMQRHPQENVISSLRCSCLTFSSSHASLSPATPCTLSGTQNLDWDTTERLSRLHGLSVTFASPETASRVLDASVPLQTSQLMNLYPAREGRPTGTMMVCGAGDEVARAVLAEERFIERVERQEERVGGVLAVLVLGIILWALGELLWERLFGRIHLRGGEKRLTVASRHCDEKEKYDCNREVKSACAYERAQDDNDDFADSPWGP